LRYHELNDNMKKMAKQCVQILGGILFTLSPVIVNAQEVKVKISEISSTKGKIMLSVFKDNKSFDDEQPYKTFSFDKKLIANGKLSVSCKIPFGTYGFALVDDENANGKMDKNMIGIPKEGFGFSNFFLTKMKKPIFNDFKFVHSASNNEVNIKIKYL
jgi:uncharacterized protein (DUF2141 family)